MKTIFAILTLLVISSAGISQTYSTVTINTAGNRNKQIVVNNKYYTIDNTAATAKPIVISDLPAGQHTLELIRTNPNNRNVSTKSTFTLRDGYDLTITVASNGSISSAETRIVRTGNSGGQLSATAFNKLYTQTKNKTSATARASFLESEFNTSKRKFTSKQASQLIQLVNSENLRFKLAKQSYTRISDQQNFSLVTDLLNSSANRNAVNAYIASLPATGTDVVVPNEKDPITAEKFAIIYNEVQTEPVGDRTWYLSNFFGRDFNYYTAAQAKQLIELIPGEEDRFTVAKAAYRGVTDKENYNIVYPLLSSLSNRSALLSYINTYESNNPRPAMATADFDKLYQSVSYQNSSNTRYNLINTAFTKPGNYFTVAQAKKLIPLVSSESSRLQLSKAAYKVLVDRSNYTQLNDLFSTAANRTDFINYVNSYNNVSVETGVAMNESDFNTIYQGIRGAWTASSRYSLASDAFKVNTNYFTVSQVKQLLTLISAENDKLALAKYSYDNIVDVANFPQLYDLFAVAGNRNDLSGFAATMQGGGTATVKIPMSDTEFKSMTNDIRFTFGLYAKYNALTEIFNKETNHFTVVQAKELIQMVSSESNRLELAKLSYNNITDPMNFSQVYDIFSSQSNKNELIAFVNSNASNK